MQIEEYDLPHLINHLRSNPTPMLTLTRNEAGDLIDFLLEEDGGIVGVCGVFVGALNTVQDAAQTGTDQLLILKIRGEAPVVTQEGINP